MVLRPRIADSCSSLAGDSTAVWFLRMYPSNAKAVPAMKLPAVFCLRDSGGRTCGLRCRGASRAASAAKRQQVDVGAGRLARHEGRETPSLVHLPCDVGTLPAEAGCRAQSAAENLIDGRTPLQDVPACGGTDAPRCGHALTEARTLEEPYRAGELRRVDAPLRPCPHRCSALDRV